MFHKFTEPARRAVNAARTEALKSRGERIGTEHILLGLLSENGGPVVELFRNLKVDQDRVREGIRALRNSPQSANLTLGQLPFSPRARRVIELANEAADALQHEAVDADHLLLGLLKEGRGVAANVLIGFGLDLDQVRDLMLEDMGAREGLSEAGKSRPVIPDGETVMFERITPRLREIVRRAKKEALLRPCTAIGSESLLLGILLEGSGTAARLLTELGAGLDRVREELRRSHPPEASPPVAVDQLPLAPLAVRDLLMADHAGRALGLNETGDELLLIALIADRHGIPFETLIKLGVRIPHLREALLRALGWSPTGS